MHQIEECAYLVNPFMTKKTGPGPTKPGCQIRKKNAGAKPRIKLPH